MPATEYEEFDNHMVACGLPDYELQYDNGRPVLVVQSQKWGISVEFYLNSTRSLRETPEVLANNIRVEIRVTGMKGVMRGHNS